MTCGQCRHGGFDEATGIGGCGLEGSPRYPVGGKGCALISRSTVACDMFQFYGETTVNGKLMRQTVDELHAKAKDLNERLTACSAAIKGLQKICEHSMRGDGHDSHHSYEKCEYCDHVEQY